MDSRLYFYQATFTSVHDGDGSFLCTFDYGRNQFEHNCQVRLGGVDAPELYGARGEEKALHALHREAGHKVQRFVEKLLLHKTLVIRPYKDPKGKYGRLLATIYIEPTEDVFRITTLNELLLKIGYAKPYDGGKKEPWTAEELNQIIKDKR